MKINFPLDPTSLSCCYPMSSTLSSNISQRDLDPHSLQSFSSLPLIYAKRSFNQGLNWNSSWQGHQWCWWNETFLSSDLTHPIHNTWHIDHFLLLETPQLSALPSPSHAAMPPLRPELFTSSPAAHNAEYSQLSFLTSPLLCLYSLSKMIQNEASHTCVNNAQMSNFILEVSSKIHILYPIIHLKYSQRNSWVLHLTFYS